VGEVTSAPARAFGDALPPGRFGALDGAPGVIVAERPWPRAFCVVAVEMAPAAPAPDLAFALPGAGRSAVSGQLQSFALGPGRWLVVGPNEAFAQLAERLPAGHEAVELSDAHAVLHVSGPKVREVLARIAPIDLHPRVFRVGDVAATRSGGLDLLLWQIDATPRFGIAVGRSYAGSLARWLMDTALSFGLVVEP
jgi:sarcosine oxidase subunit gamma